MSLRTHIYIKTFRIYEEHYKIAKFSICKTYAPIIKLFIGYNTIINYKNIKKQSVQTNKEDNQYNALQENKLIIK